MHWQLTIAALVFAAVVLAPAAVLWCLGLSLLSENERRPGRTAARSGTRATRRLRLSHRLAWAALLVIVAYGIYGLGLAMQWGHRASVLLAVAASTVLFPPILVVLYRKARRLLARRRGPVILVALLAGPALVPPLLLWFLMGGANWKIVLTLSLFGPLVLLPAFLARSRVLSIVTRRQPRDHRTQNDE